MLFGESVIGTESKENKDVMLQLTTHAPWSVCGLLFNIMVGIQIM